MAKGKGVRLYHRIELLVFNETMNFLRSFSNDLENEGLILNGQSNIQVCVQYKELTLSCYCIRIMKTV